MLTRFYTGRQNATNKSCLFDAKFFEFEEFSIDTFFLGSIQPQHAVWSIILGNTILGRFFCLKVTIFKRNFDAWFGGGVTILQK